VLVTEILLHPVALIRVHNAKPAALGSAAGYLWGFRPHDLRRIYWYIDGAVRASAALVAAAR
jgi:hypothetical protein